MTEEQSAGTAGRVQMLSQDRDKTWPRKQVERHLHKHRLPTQSHDSPDTETPATEERERWRAFWESGEGKSIRWHDRHFGLPPATRPCSQRHDQANPLRSAQVRRKAAPASWVGWTR